MWKKVRQSIMCAVIIMSAVYSVAYFLDNTFPEEVETYTEGFEINHMEISQKHNRVGGGGYISVRNDNHATTFFVDLDTYAKYEVGEVVEVEVRECEYRMDKGGITDYKLIG